MSRDELVQAYAEGALDRRAFIRRLAAAGVSLGAAVSYAHLLAPEAEAVDAVISLDNQYPDLDLAIRSRSTERVAETGVVKVKVECDDSASVELGVDVRHQGKRQLIGRKRLRFTAGGERVVRVPISRKGRNILGSREKARLRVTGTAIDTDSGDAGAFDTDRAHRGLR